MSGKVARATVDQLARASLKYKKQEDARQFQSSETGLAFIVEDDGEIVGWCWGHHMVRPDGSTMVYLHEIEVDEDVRRRGYGRLLIDAVLDAARTAKATKVFLVTEHSNEPARALYESAGAHRSDAGTSVVYRWMLDGGGAQHG